MNLTLVIPVHNDQANLDRLLIQAGEMGIFSQVILVDDASEPAITSPETLPCGQSHTRSHPCPVQLIRHDTLRGAGAARNRAIPEIQTSHVIFFDSDDLFTPDFVPLWHDLQDHPFDFCLFRYHDSERGYFGGWGQVPLDEACWRLAGIDTSISAPRLVSGNNIWSLAEASNFPWNKIYNTAFVHAHSLRCTEIPVHNDIELHWRSFLLAERILVSPRIAALHMVHPQGNRLTNRKREERLQVFSALTRVAGCVSAPDRTRRATLAFLRFTSSLLQWIDRGIDAELRCEFRRRTHAFLSAFVSPELYADLIRSDPVLALQVALQMGLQSSQPEVIRP